MWTIGQIPQKQLADNYESRERVGFQLTHANYKTREKLYCGFSNRRRLPGTLGRDPHGGNPVKSSNVVPIRPFQLFGHVSNVCSKHLVGLASTTSRRVDLVCACCRPQTFVQEGEAETYWKRVRNRTRHLFQEPRREIVYTNLFSSLVSEAMGGLYITDWIPWISLQNTR